MQNALGAVETPHFATAASDSRAPVEDLQQRFATQTMVFFLSTIKSVQPNPNSVPLAWKTQSNKGVPR